VGFVVETGIAVSLPQALFPCLMPPLKFARDLVSTLSTQFALQLTQKSNASQRVGKCQALSHIHALNFLYEYKITY
jgi:hypothetical protein